MQSRLIVNLVLLLLVIGLGLLAYNNNDAPETAQTLTTINADTITSITITHNKRVTTIQKIDKHWKIISPVNVTANKFRINTILKLLSTKSYGEYAADSLDLKQYGLQQVGTSILFNAHRIDFGMINPINNYRYVKINNKVHLIDDHHYPLLSSQTGALVARNLLPADSKINKLVLPEQTLALSTNEKWISTNNVSTDAIVETINHWRNTEAFGVHNYNERESLASIEVYIDNHYEPIKFTITDVDPWLVIARPDIKLEYHFNLEMYDLLLRPGAAKELPNELSEQSERVSNEEFMEALNQKPR